MNLRPQTKELLFLLLPIVIEALAGKGTLAFLAAAGRSIFSRPCR
jgi:hypothetical protein